MSTIRNEDLYPGRVVRFTGESQSFATAEVEAGALYVLKEQVDADDTTPEWMAYSFAEGKDRRLIFWTIREDPEWELVDE